MHTNLFVLFIVVYVVVVSSICSFVYDLFAGKAKYRQLPTWKPVAFWISLLGLMFLVFAIVAFLLNLIVASYYVFIIFTAIFAGLASVRGCQLLAKKIKQWDMDTNN